MKPTKLKPPTWDIWVWGRGIGWWLTEREYDNLSDALAGLEEAIKGSDGEASGGCVIPTGQASNALPSYRHIPDGKKKTK
jgi:hypothetical protein